MGSLVPYIKAQLGITTQVSVIKAMVTVTKNRNQFPLNNFNLLRPIDSNLAVWVAYINMQLGIATQMSVIKVKVTCTKIETQLSLNNFSLLWPIDTKFVV